MNAPAYYALGDDIDDDVFDEQDGYALFAHQGEATVPTEAN